MATPMGDSAHWLHGCMTPGEQSDTGVGCIVPAVANRIVNSRKWGKPSPKSVGVLMCGLLKELLWLTWLKITQQLTGNMQDSSKIAKDLSACFVVLSIHTARRVDHKSYSVNTESKKHNGLHSTILCVYIKHTDVQIYEFFKHKYLFWSVYLCRGRERGWKLELIKDNKTRTMSYKELRWWGVYELRHMIYRALHQENKNQSNSNRLLKKW